VPSKLHRDLDTAQDLLTGAMTRWRLAQPAWDLALSQLDRIAEAIARRDQDALNEALQQLEGMEPGTRSTRVDGPAQPNAPTPFIARVSELVHDLGNWKTSASTAANAATPAQRSAKDAD
jgi:hypothetical protein